MRTLIMILVTALALALAAGSAAADAKGLKAAIMLQSSVKVDSNVIRLGDLFTNTGEQADTAVAYAPEPGKRASFDARWLYRVARAYRLDWRPMNNRVRTMVTRTSQVIGRDEIAGAVLDALADRGVDTEADIEFSNRFLKLHVPGNTLAGISVDDIHFEPRSQRFNAIISAPADSPEARQFRIRGKLHTTVDVPVLAHRVLAGERIKRADIKWLKIRSRRVQPNTAMSEADIVGMTPRRGLRPGYPILLSSVRRPILVAKGSLVTMYLQVPKMVLTAQGKALQNGSDGDVIRVKNSQSNTTVEAEIVGPGKVAVRPTAQLAMN